MNRQRMALLAVLTIVASLTTSVRFATPAGAAFPGHNGRIVFTMTVPTRHPFPGTDIFSIRPDGRGLRRLTFTHDASTPAWGPGGGRILYARPDGIWIMHRDGSHKRRVVRGGSSPAWSPKGGRFAFTAPGRRPGTKRSDQVYIYTFATRKSRQLTNFKVHWTADFRPFNDGASPAWSPRGTRIAFVRHFGDCTYPPGDNHTALYMTTPGRTRSHRLTRSDRVGAPDWAPGSARLVTTDYEFGDCVDGLHGALLVTRHANGTVISRIVAHGAGDTVWSPNGRLLAWTRGSYIWFIRPDGVGARHIRVSFDEQTVLSVDWCRW